MDRSRQLVAILLFVCVLSGCGQREASEPEGPVFPSDPAAQAAYDFLDAVLKGDSSRASACLTPRAMQQIVQSGKQFAPPGLETASFKIGEVRKTSDTQALVQCLLSDTSPYGQERSEEICCLMRLVDDQWHVSGIAYSAGPNKPPMILDFENPAKAAAAPQQTVENSVAPDTSAPAGRPSPPRVAQDPAYTPPQ